MRQIIIFLVCFALGAAVALIVRSALHRPYGEGDAPAVRAPAVEAPAPHRHDAAPAPGAHPAPAPGAAHPGHDPVPAPAAPSPAAGAAQPPVGALPGAQPAGPVVNTICPACGMDVDPAVKPVPYRDKAIGLGCPACTAKVKRELERHGEAALRNEQAK